MKITRRSAVASLLVIAVAVVLGAPAPASGGGQKTTVKLYPTADSPGQHATGVVTLYPADTPPAYSGVGVSVSKLAPNALYYMPVAVYYYNPWLGWIEDVYNVPIQTDARGKGGGGFFGYPDYYVAASSQVYDSSGTLVLTYSR